MRNGIARLVCCIGLPLLAVALNTMVVQAAPENPTLSFAMASSTTLGEVVELKARLTSAAGAPVAGATISFAAPATFFLGATSDVVLARVLTDKDGVAEALYQIRSSGQLTVRAEFAGNDRYASAKAGSQITVEDTGSQLYVQEAGVRIPGINATPLSGNAGEHAGAKTGLAVLWPAISFWPIGLVLTIVWSLYAFVVVLIFRIVRSTKQVDTWRTGVLVKPNPRNDRAGFGRRV